MRVSPSSAVPMMFSRLPLVSSKRTLPPISDMVAIFLGLRASNSSSTRGRPWVMSPPANAAGMEGTHGQLRTGLADGLGGNDADRLADLDGLAGGQVHAVALGAEPS